MLLNKKKWIIPLLVLLSFTVTANIVTPTQKLYPPYPEVWGYDISDYPAIKNAEASVYAFRMKDGDIWFVVDFDFEHKDKMKRSSGGYKKSEYVLIKFFKKEVIKINPAEFNDIANKISDDSIGGFVTNSESEIKFKDGSSIKHITSPIPKRCATPDYINNYILKTNSNGQQSKLSILAAYPYIQWYYDEGYCEHNSASFIYQKLYFLADYFIDLGDDTFIVFSTGSNLILRFNKNFETKFKPQHPITYFNGNYINRNFFVIEYDLIEKLQRELSDKPLPLYQSVHDNLLLHFKEKYDDKINE